MPAPSWRNSDPELGVDRAGAQVVAHVHVEAARDDVLRDGREAHQRPGHGEGQQHQEHVAHERRPLLAQAVA
jgi:hypothetical protein